MKMHFLKRYNIAVIGCVAVCALLCSCSSVPDNGAMISAQRQKDRGEQSPQEQVADYEDLAVLTEALLLVKRYYVEERDFTDLVYSAIDGVLSDLDPNSSFLAAESLRALDDTTKGKFVGIGVNVENGASGIKVIAPLEESPAFKAGIKAGDTIISIDGRSLQGLSLNDAVKKMRGKNGTSVKVTVERKDGAKEQMDIVRENIKLSCIESCRILDDHIGYMRVRQFTSATTSEVKECLKELAGQGAEKLIFDLRDNPGGILSAAVGVSDIFLNKNALIVTLKSRTAAEPVHEYKAGGRGYKLLDTPLVVLVNEGSASAAEVVAGALHDNKRATLVGNRTYGKASVQSVVKMSLRPECAVKLTTGYYYTPDGTMIHGEGIAPDDEVQITFETRKLLKHYYMREAYLRHSSIKNEVDAPEDRQIERAKEILSQKKI